MQYRISKQHSAMAVALLTGLFGAAPAAQAAGYTFTDNPISGPSDLGAYSTPQNSPLAINNSGLIAGQYASTNSNNYGFVGNSKINYGVVSVPVSIAGIDSAGDIVGSYKPSAKAVPALFYSTAASYGAATPTQTLGNDTNTHGSTVNNQFAAGITDTNLLVGSDTLANGSSYIFEYNTVSKTFTDLSLPIDTSATGNSVTADAVSSDGTYIAGNYGDTNSLAHGFVYDTVTNTFTTIDDPNADSNSTYVTGVNKAGEVVGQYLDASGNNYGFIYNAVSNSFSNAQLSDPLADTVGTTVIGGINDNGVIVGISGSLSNLYTATPAVAAVPLPGSIWLMSAALAGFRLLARRKA